MARFFFLVVTDRDKGAFTIEGPMADDTAWTLAVCRAQNAGRQVNCHNPDCANREQIAADMQREFGLRLAQSGSIVRP